MTRPSPRTGRPRRPTTRRRHRRTPLGPRLAERLAATWRQALDFGPERSRPARRPASVMAPCSPCSRSDARSRRPIRRPDIEAFLDEVARRTAAEADGLVRRRRRAAHLSPGEGARMGRRLPAGPRGGAPADPPGQRARRDRGGAPPALRRDHPGPGPPVALVVPPPRRQDDRAASLALPPGGRAAGRARRAARPAGRAAATRCRRARGRVGTRRRGGRGRRRAAGDSAVRRAPRLAPGAGPGRRRAAVRHLPRLDAGGDRRRPPAARSPTWPGSRASARPSSTATARRSSRSSSGPDRRARSRPPRALRRTTRARGPVRSWGVRGGTVSDHRRSGPRPSIRSSRRSPWLGSRIDERASLSVARRIQGRLARQRQTRGDPGTQSHGMARREPAQPARSSQPGCRKPGSARHGVAGPDRRGTAVGRNRCTFISTARGAVPPRPAGGRRGRR